MPLHLRNVLNLASWNAGIAREMPGRMSMVPLLHEQAAAVGFSLLQFGCSDRWLSCAAALAIAAWAVAMMSLLFTILKFTGLLRVSDQAEESGLDVALHGGSCYPEAYEGGPVQPDQSCRPCKVSPLPDDA
jgi:hypothetical protein